MGHSGAALQVWDDRAVPREAVHLRTRGTGPGGRTLAMLLVNISVDGFMARVDRILPADRLSVHLPGIGLVEAEVRWALGGRAGCRFVRPLAPDAYRNLLEQHRT